MTADPGGWQTARLERGAAAVANADATRAAMTTFESGGNAIDAAVAAAFAVGVVDPLDSGLGGSGFMLVHQAATGRTIAIDFLSTAPAAVRYDLIPGAPSGETAYHVLVSGRANELGHRAVAVPGAVRGLTLALSRFGSKELPEVLAPAIRLAREGFTVSRKCALRMQRSEYIVRSYPEMRTLLTDADDQIIGKGTHLAIPDLAWSLETLAEDGPEAFYSGRIARLIVDEMRANGGFLSADDLAAYRPIVRQPHRGEWRGYEVATMPPPSSGAFILGTLRELDRQGIGPGDSRYAALARAMRDMFALRGRTLGDPAFTPVDLSAWGVDRGWEGPDHASETAETTSLATVDAEGNAVCITYSNNNHSGVIVPGTGIVLNNQMMLFNPWPGSPNSVAPGKRPMSSMSPTLLFRDGRVRIAVGASGSTRIPTAILQTLFNHVVLGHDLPEAMTTPRIHGQGGTVAADAEIADLARPIAEDLGCSLEPIADRDYFLGVVQAIRVADDGTATAAADPRAGGAGMVS